MRQSPHLPNPHTPRQPERGPWLLRVYRVALWAYPAVFRRAYGAEMWQVARDAYAAAQANGAWATTTLWLRLLVDLARSATAERKAVMRLPIVFAAVLAAIAGSIAVLASLDLYLLEDGNPLTSAAYRASPLLAASYDAAYLSALVAGVGVCAIVAYALFGASQGARRGATGALAALALLVALAGFGGLLVRAPLTFAALFVGFAALAGGAFVAGRGVAARLRRQRGERTAAALGACVGFSAALLVNVVALTLHTLALNPASHPLYMQGQIPGTHLNAVLIGLALALFTVALYASSLLAALRAHA